MLIPKMPVISTCISVHSHNMCMHMYGFSY